MLGYNENDMAVLEEKTRLRGLLTRIMSKHAPPGGMMLLIALQIIPRILYRASRASWTLRECIAFDKILSAAYRRILALGPTFPEALIYLPKAMHGLGITRFSDAIQIHKWNIWHRVSSLGHIHESAAKNLFRNMVQGLTLTPPPTYYLTSLAKWLEPMNIVPNTRPSMPFTDICPFLQHSANCIRDFPLHAIFTDGSLSSSTNTVKGMLMSNYTTKSTSNGSAAIVLFGDPDSWRSCPPFVIRICVNAINFPGINAYVMEVLAQRIALSLLPLTNIHRIFSDCQSAVNSVRAVIHSQLKKSLGSAPAGVLLAGLPPAPNCNVEWTRSHPERRQKNRQKWSYQDWGIFLADAAASGDWAHFYSIFGIEEMTPRIVTFNLLDIIFDLLAPHQCYWAWKHSQLPVIGDLTEFRLHKHTLPLYLTTRDADRATRGQPSKWVSLNTASLSMLPVGSTWKMLKRFCFTTYDKYAHGRNRAKGEGDPLCTVCFQEDSLLHILCECNRINLQAIR
jgi:hypothetical protein